MFTLSKSIQNRLNDLGVNIEEVLNAGVKVLTFDTDLKSLEDLASYNLCTIEEQFETAIIFGLDYLEQA